MKSAFLLIFILTFSVSASESEIPGKVTPPKATSLADENKNVDVSTNSEETSEVLTIEDTAGQKIEEAGGMSVPPAVVKVKKSDEEFSLPPDFEMKTDNISDKYFAGAFLIYDCEEKHWVCVLEENYRYCEEQRKESVQKKERQLPCAPIGEFPTKRSCFQRELFLAGHAHGNRFCLLDEIKKEELE
ncbi:MAG: hypothetical protein V4598_01695 [Bdellovibrionota bacterium]